MSQWMGECTHTFLIRQRLRATFYLNSKVVSEQHQVETSGIISNYCYVCCSEMTAVHTYNVLQYRMKVGRLIFLCLYLQTTSYWYFIVCIASVPSMDVALSLKENLRTATRYPSKARPRRVSLHSVRAV